MKLIETKYSFIPLLEDPHHEIADPFIFHENGTFYMYSTTNQKEIKVYTSTNLMQWDHRKSTVVYTSSKKWWLSFYFGGGSGVWAPELIKYKDMYYVYFTEKMDIYVMEGKSPLGPFSPPELIKKSAIDAHPFIDKNGELYLFYTVMNWRHYFSKMELLYMSKMATPRIPYLEKRILTATLPWEFKKQSRYEPTGLIEGPYVIYRNNQYILFYSSCCAETINYGIGVATSYSIWGPYKKQKTPLLQKMGSGHSSIVTVKDTDYLLCHRKKSSKKGWNRIPILYKMGLNS